jgi:hypothetical protein
MPIVPAPNVTYKCHIGYTVIGSREIVREMISIVEIDADSHDFELRAPWNTRRNGCFHDDDDEIDLEVKESDKIGVSYLDVFTVNLSNCLGR